jgi:hypothetical protein
MWPDQFVSTESISYLSLFLQRDYPGKKIMWKFFHLLSTSQCSSRSNHCSQACCNTILNHLEKLLLRSVSCSVS